MIITYNSENDIQQLLCGTAPAPALQTRGVQPDLAQARPTPGLGLGLRSCHGDTSSLYYDSENNSLVFHSTSTFPIIRHKLVCTVQHTQPVCGGGRQVGITEYLLLQEAGAGAGEVTL